MSSFACAITFLLPIILLIINAQSAISSKGNETKDIKMKPKYTHLKKLKAKFIDRRKMLKPKAVRLPIEMKHKLTKKLGRKSRTGKKFNVHKKKHKHLIIKSNRRKTKNVVKGFKKTERRFIRFKKGKKSLHLKKSRTFKNILRSKKRENAMIKKNITKGGLSVKKPIKKNISKRKMKQGANFSKLKPVKGKGVKTETSTKSLYDEHNKWHKHHGKPLDKESNYTEDYDFGESYLVKPLEDGFKMSYTDSDGKTVYIDQYENVNYHGVWYKDLSEFKNNPNSGKTRDEFVKRMKTEEVPHEGYESWRRSGYKDEIGNIVIFNKKKAQYLVNGNKWMDTQDYDDWIRFEKLKKRMKKYGGNPDKYDVGSICYTMDMGKCYQKGDLVCEKRDWENYCIKGYYPITRYNIHGKIESLEPERFSHHPRPREYDRMEHYISGSKQACVTDSEQCVPLDRVLGKYPNLGVKIKSEFAKLVNKPLDYVGAHYFNSLRDGNDNIYVDSKRVNGNTDGLSILLNLIKQGGDSQCAWLVDMFPFLAGPFSKFGEACSLT